METVILVLHVLAALTVIGLVLLQHGKGADMGAAFGSGSSGSLFGSTGSANFLSRATAILAAIFFTTSLGLTWLSSHTGDSVGVMGARPGAPEQRPQPAVPPAPASSTADSAPASAPMPQAPANAAQSPAPAGQDGSKSNEIPK